MSPTYPTPTSCPAQVDHPSHRQRGWLRRSTRGRASRHVGGVIHTVSLSCRAVITVVEAEKQGTNQVAHHPP